MWNIKCKLAFLMVLVGVIKMVDLPTNVAPRNGEWISFIFVGIGILGALILINQARLHGTRFLYNRSWVTGRGALGFYLAILGTAYLTTVGSDVILGRNPWQNWSLLSWSLFYASIAVLLFGSFMWMSDGCSGRSKQ